MADSPMPNRSPLTARLAVACLRQRKIFAFPDRRAIRPNSDSTVRQVSENAACLTHCYGAGTFQPGFRLEMKSLFTVHGRGKISGRRCRQQVMMAVHQTKGVDDRMVSLRGGLKGFQKPFRFPPALENGPALVTAGGDVIESAGKSDYPRTCHVRPPRISR